MTQILIFGDDVQANEALGAEMKAADPSVKVGYRNGNFFKVNELEECDAVYLLTHYPAVAAAYGDKVVSAKTSAKAEAKSEAKTETGTPSQKSTKKGK